MKNIHIIPTDKSSRLIHNDANQLCYQSNKSFKNDRKWMYRKKFNIYITSDEKIKEGDWYLDTTINVVFKNDNIFLNGVGYKKIILTTDQSLDGIQAIDDTFLEWFVKNPSCESVETYSLGVKNQLTGESGHYKYEIIIPKEYHEHGQEVGHSVQVERMYSEEDLKEAYFSAIKSTGDGWNGEYANGNNPDIKKEFTEEFEEWFEQFKKK